MRLSKPYLRNELISEVVKNKDSYEKVQIKRFIDAYDCVRDFHQKSIKLLIRGSFEEAVFYIGAMIHYISDCACFTHVVDYSNVLKKEYVSKLGLIYETFKSMQSSNENFSRNPLTEIFQEID